MGFDHDVFMSHATNDSDRVRELLVAWEAEGLDVYVDFNDPVLIAASEKREMTEATAEHLRGAIIRCRIFVFVASQASVSSGWMPWELGMAHGAIGRAHICELEEGSMKHFGKKEYLKLYDSYIFQAGDTAYVKAAVEKARGELVPPSEDERNRLIGEDFIKLMIEQGSAEAMRKFAEIQRQYGLGTMEGAGKASSETSSSTFRPAKKR